MNPDLRKKMSPSYAERIKGLLGRKALKQISFTITSHQTKGVAAVAVVVVEVVAESWGTFGVGRY